jgi:hypothetical protein
MPIDIVLEYFPAFDTLTMTWCSAPGASMRAWRGMLYLYQIYLIVGSYIFMGVPLRAYQSGSKRV